MSYIITFSNRIKNFFYNVYFFFFLCHIIFSPQCIVFFPSCDPFMIFHKTIKRSTSSRFIARVWWKKKKKKTSYPLQRHYTWGNVQYTSYKHGLKCSLIREVAPNSWLHLSLFLSHPHTLILLLTHALVYWCHSSRACCMDMCANHKMVL